MKICRPLRFVWFGFEINFNVLMSELFKYSIETEMFLFNMFTKDKRRIDQMFFLLKKIPLVLLICI